MELPAPCGGTPIGERILLAGLVGVVTAISVLPMARLAIEGLLPGSTPFSTILSARTTWVAFGNTLETALAGTVVSLLLGVPMALLAGLTDLRARPLLVFAFMLPLMIPSQVTAIAWLELFGPGSPVLKPLGLAPRPGTGHPLHGPAGISLLLGIEHAPLVFLALAAALRALPRDLIEAAEAAGAGQLRIVRTIVLPMMGPALIAGAVLAFVSSIGNFGTPALLGIPGGYTVLTVLIFQKLAGFGPRVLADVAALSLLLGVLAVAGVALQHWLGRRSLATANPGRGPGVLALGAWRVPIEAAVWTILLAIAVVPLLALLGTALVSAYGVPLSWQTATLENFHYILFRHGATARAFVNSFALAGAAAAILTLLAVPLGYFIAWRGGRLARLLDIAAELPYALPGTVLAIACILVFLKPLPFIGLSLYDTPWIILVAYLARFLTLTLRTMVAGYRQIDRALEEAAEMTGARLGRRLVTIILPLIAPVAAAGALLVFLVALNELTVSALLWSSGHETLGVVVFSLEQGGETTLAAALSVIAAGATIAMMLLATLFARRLPPGILPWQA